MKRNRYTPQELIHFIQEKAKELGRTPTAGEMKNPCSSAYSNRFGSWNNALRAAGLQINKAHAGDCRVKKKNKKKPE
ncbi:homing endonuclease associated repeat-containing protein [Eubacterium limosum]|uniref:homing endonuclease associated repeat-containing protein n=1 Tax=Eubacterium limosum TaxID=1736 RepID=UPI003720335F